MKEYECKNKIGSQPTMFFEANRELSGFNMKCNEFGKFDFVNITENWNICLQDIECTVVPPEIPTDPEYVLWKDDGRVKVERYVYPLPVAPIVETFTSEHNRSLLPRNYNAKLV